MSKNPRTFFIKKMPTQGRWKWCLPEQSKTELTKRNGQVGLLFILSWNLFLCLGNVIHVSRAESPLWKRRVRRIKYLVFRLQILVRRPGWNGHTGGRKGYIQKPFVDCFVSFRGISFFTQKTLQQHGVSLEDILGALFTLSGAFLGRLNHYCWNDPHFAVPSVLRRPPERQGKGDFAREADFVTMGKPHSSQVRYLFSQKISEVARLFS